MELILLGITGRARHGKDTLFRCLQRSAGGTLARLAFGDGVKEELAEACGVTAAEIEADKPRFRGGLQWWGTEFRRGLHGEDYWIRRLERKLHLMRDTPLNGIVITDVRFPNEAALVQSRGGWIIRVVRPQVDEGVPPHLSETAMDSVLVDSTILNDGCLTGLQEAADALWRYVCELKKSQNSSCADLADGYSPPRS
jgi:hypothetical protein